MDIIDIKLKEAEMSQFLDVHSKSRSRTEHVSFNLIQYTSGVLLVSFPDPQYAWKEGRRGSGHETRVLLDFSSSCPFSREGHNELI